MPDGTIEPNIDYVALFSTATETVWPTIASAHADAIDIQRRLREAIEAISGDQDLVAFGSLARREWTNGSDVDWTLLIDGTADSEHRKTSRRIAKAIEDAGLAPPGSEGIFGNMAFSHELVHHIGGQADSNRNTTQRILMLLEAVSLTTPQDDISGYERTVRQILRRYLKSDSNFHTREGNDSRIPRFLLNDIVRYWRTICVDFAYKDWEQGGKKWAIRNIKLRTSRKLLFVAGLFTVFSCYKNETLARNVNESKDYSLPLEEHLLNFVHATPLNIFVWTLKNLGFESECGEFLNAYEEFLSLLDNKSIRRRLEELSEEDVYEDEAFIKCRKVSYRLQDVLSKICFEKNSHLRDFIAEYGVF